MFRILGAAMLSTTLLAGCSADGSEISYSTSESAPTQLVQPSGRRLGRGSLAQHFRDLSKAEPGFTGVFYDAEGRITISSVEGTLSDQSTDRVLSWLRAQVGIVAQRSEVRWVRVPYDYATLRNAYESADFVLKSSDGLLESWVDETSGVIRLGLQTLSDTAALRSRLVNATIPRDMVKFHGAVQAHGESTLNQKIRPTVGGIEIHHLNGGGCTLGLNVLNWNTGINPATDPKYMLTASHCAGTGMGVIIPYGIGQLSDTVAVEFEVPPVVYYPNFRCPSPTKSPCQEADVLSSKYFDTVSVAYGNVANVDASKNITGFYNVQGTISGAIVGATITTVGATSGKSTGTIAASCVDVAVLFSGRGTVWELCQDRSNYSTSGGDSGAPVFIPYMVGNPNTPSVVGIHSSSNGTICYFTPISGIDMVFGYAYYYQ